MFEGELIQIKKEIKRIEKQKRFKGDYYLKLLKFEQSRFEYADQEAEKEINRVLKKFEFLEIKRLKLEKAMKPISFKKLKQIYDSKDPLDEVFVYPIHIADLRKLTQLTETVKK